jgi:two-component system response regulator
MTVDVREILLVEDNMADARMTIMALEDKKIANKIIHVKDGAEALDYVFRRGAYTDKDKTDLPVLILLDLKMPKVNGIEVLEALKSDEKTRKIPVTVFTSSQEDPDVKRCYELGVNSYVVKPLDFDSFNVVVQDIGLYWLVVNHLNG